MWIWANLTNAIMEDAAMSGRRRLLSEIIAEWWQERRNRSGSAAMEKSRRDKLERAAEGLGLAIGELHSISGKAHYTTNLLPLRMSLLHLDASEVARSDPKLLRELEASCRLCEDKLRCTRDIAQDAANPKWHEYCPNAMVLRAMQARNKLTASNSAASCSRRRADSTCQWTTSFND
jgi:hypothetical protein